MAKALKFRQNNLTKQPGEKARLKVVQGPDVGVVFVIPALSAKIGRGEENDVVLSDLKTSRVHARIFFDGRLWNVEDMKSANGIHVNGKETPKQVLKTSDVIALGATVLEFFPGDVAESMLTAPPADLLLKLESEKRHELERNDRIQKMTSFGGVPKPGAVATADYAHKLKSATPQRIFLVLLALVSLVLLMPDSKPPTERKVSSMTNNTPVAADLTQFLPAEAASETQKQAEMFYKMGFREYREGNFLRAMLNFETALQISPGHRLSKLYLENSKKSVDLEVQEQLSLGNKSYKTGKLRKAKGHYEAVIRLLFRDPKNQNYSEAQKQLQKVENEIKEST